MSGTCANSASDLGNVVAMAEQMIVNDNSVEEVKGRISEGFGKDRGEMAEVAVHVEAEVNPTESEEKVKAAVNNILGNAAHNS